MAALVRICRLASCTTVKRLNNSLSFSRSLHAASCANLITRTSQKGRITGVLARLVLQINFALFVTDSECDHSTRGPLLTLLSEIPHKCPFL